MDNIQNPSRTRRFITPPHSSFDWVSPIRNSLNVRPLVAAYIFSFFASTMAQGSPSDTAPDCTIQDRRLNKGLRVGSLFIVLVTSSLGMLRIPFTIIKQFGTGVIISTAYVHLLQESSGIFANPCMGELGYESTPTAIAIAGIILAFIVEYVGDRFIQFRASSIQNAPSGAEDGSVGGENTNAKATKTGAQEDSNCSAVPAVSHHGFNVHGHTHGLPADDKLSVLVMEAGIIAHSVLIGITLAVADQSAFATFLIVIVFHQGFEGLALGARIAALTAKHTSLWEKLIMGFAFAVTTPIGVAIGLGVLQTFNGNDKHTLLALGTLDALSAGILAWVGLVEMLARDWVFVGGEMKVSGLVKTLVGALSLVAGLVLMSLLGKWT